jgi:diguanylate cyclase (GGDEF)-like protein
MFLKVPAFVQQFFSRFGWGTRLIFIISLHILIIGINGYIIYYMIGIMRMDAKLINYGGVVRGSIQKVIKLESNGIKATKDIHTVDTILNKFLHTDKNEITRSDMGAFLQQLELVNTEWRVLKNTIYRYRLNHNAFDKNRMMAESEACWKTANQSVEMAQTLSETKLGLFNILFVIFFIDLLLIIIIIWLINSIVRNNLERNAYFDALTGISNRRVFEESLQKEIERSVRYDLKFSLLLFDIDHFKIVNDTYGHDVGDQVLKQLTTLIGKSIRTSDLFSRIGGEEFAIIALQSDFNAAVELAEKICKDVASYTFETITHLTISIGVAQYTLNETKEQLFKNADNALYKAKQRGRNRVVAASGVAAI